MTDWRKKTYCNNALKGLSPLLESWVSVVEGYSASVRGDACWWYNERASISILAGAAWRVPTGNWVALEEFSTKKARGERTEDGAHAQGRCDLWIKHGSASFAIEAKQAWQPIGDTVAYPTLEVEKQRDNAWHDAGKLIPQEADHRLALCFVVPSIAPTNLRGAASDKEKRERVEEMVKAFCQMVFELPEVHAYAASFPEVNQLLTAEDGYVYPGVLAVFRERFRGS